jgi:hypothetical protein
MCRGDQHSFSTSSTRAAQSWLPASLPTRPSRACHGKPVGSSGAVAVRSVVRPTSRDTVDTLRPSSAAIAVSVLFCAQPHEIACRSSSDNRNRAARRAPVPPRPARDRAYTDMPGPAAPRAGDASGGREGVAARIGAPASGRSPTATRRLRPNGPANAPTSYKPPSRAHPAHRPDRHRTAERRRQDLAGH